MKTQADLDPHRLHLELASEFEELEVAVEAAQAFADSYIEDEDLAYKVVLLTSEAVTNAMEHGNSLDPGKKVRMELQLFPDHIALCVEDEGPGFDPNAVSDPLAADNLLNDGGRGLFLIEELADEVTYENEGRRIRLRMNRL